jgi:ESS family glutamate:Na+ symporter
MKEFSVAVFFEALLLISVFLIVAHALKRMLFKNMIIPVSLVAGLIALILGPQVLGFHISEFGFLKGIIPKGLLSEEVIATWKEIPQYLITIVFAGLFLGKKIPSVKKIMNTSLPNLGFGYILALGQYVVGLLVAVFILHPYFNLNKLSGALIAIGFQGGHGTVAGLQNSFNELGFTDGTDLGLGIATIGIILAILVGTIISNTPGVHKDDNFEMSDDDPTLEVKNVSFTLQAAVIGISISLAWLILELLRVAESSLLSEGQFKIIKYVPLFPVAMLTGLLLQKIFVWLNLHKYISRKQIRFISNISLDILIVAALGSLSIKALTVNIYPLLILAGAGTLYNLIVYFLLAPQLFGANWQTRGLGELGQSMGTTAIGLVMLKREGGRSPDILNDFSYKQPFYEPIVGGGLITALALPLIANFGVWISLAGIVVLLLTVGFIAVRTIRK